MTQLATLACILGILGVFWLDRDGQETHTSPALWLPLIWLGLNGSRNPSEWLSVFRTGYFPGSMASDGSDFDRYLFLALTLIGMAVLVNRGRIANVLLANWPVLLFFTYCGMSILWSDSPDITFRRWIKALGDLTMVLIVVTDADPHGAIKRLFTRLGFVLLPISILFMRYYIRLGRSYGPLGTAEYGGVTGNKNLMGLITMIFGLCMLWEFLLLWRDRKERPVRGPLLTRAAVLAMCAYLFFRSDSMTSLACFLIGSSLIGLVFISKMGRRLGVIHVVVASMVFVALFALFASAGAGLLGTFNRDQTLTGRTDIWRLALSLQGNPVVGTGYETFWTGRRFEQVVGYYWFHLNEAHEGYIDMYLELGWIGIFLLGLLIAKGYRNACVLFRQDWALGALKIAFIVSAVIYNLTESGFRMLNPIWFAFLFAITVDPKRATQEAVVPQEMDQLRGFVEPTPEFAVRERSMRRPFEAV